MSVLAPFATLRLLTAVAVASTTGVVSSSAPPPGQRVAVLSIDVNNFTSLPDDPPARLAALSGSLRERLAGCGYEVRPVDPAAEASARVGSGYLYAHPDAAARLARTAGADWVLVPRLNRASPYVSDLQVHVVRAADGIIVSNRVVELKAFGSTPEVTAHLAKRGGAWMADQVSQVLELAAAGGGGGPPARRCRA
jgi:hypothetical protein